jgi:hypothetical protein
MMVTVKKYCGASQNHHRRAPKGSAARDDEMMCATQTCFSQTRPQMRAYSFGKALQQAGEFSSFGAADQGP